MSWGGDGDQSFPPSVLNKSQLFHVNLPPTFLWKWPPKKPKFNDVCILFKHSHFCSRVPEIHSKRPRFKHFCHGPCPQTPLVTCTFSTCKLPLWCKFFFSFSAYSKAFATYLKPYWQPSFQTFCQGACPRTPLITYTYTFGACKLRLWCKFFFLHCLLQSFCHLPKTLMTTRHVLFNTSFLCLMPVLLAVCTFPTFFCFQNQRWILKGFSRSLSY